MNTKLNSFGCPLVYVGGEEFTRKGKTRKKRKEGRVTEQGMVKVITPLSKIPSQEQREEYNVSYIEDLTKIHRFRAQVRRVNGPEKGQSYWVER